MDDSLLSPGGPNRSKQIQDAKDMYDAIVHNAEKSGSEVPPYEFLELIGKGAFGRVYKCRKTDTSQLVAIKIVNTDDADFEADPRERDETVKDFRKEVGILQQLKDYRAKNINMIHDAFDLHSQLWIISDFCTGGSIRTLMRANPNRGLENRFLIPIARELALALKSVHDIGVIHRDLKCANVYVTEDGRIQLGDFGVVGIMDNGIAKRTTIIGTPWYMPREMHVDTFSVEQGYGKEVDIWAYGCTIYEMATGLAPNATVAQHMLGTVLDQQAPRLQGDGYSDDLRDFVAYCLNSDPTARPSADQILMHPYIAGTRNSHPTQSLVALIDRYIVWEHKGGQRTSLFNPGGAAAPVRLAGVDNDGEEEDDDDDNDDEDDDEGKKGLKDTDDWNFNTSDSFYPGFAKRYSHMISTEDDDPQFEAPAGSGLPPIRTKDLTPLERIQREHMAKSADRGERSLDRIWNQEARPYDLHNPVPTQEPSNDLPLRDYSSDSAPRESTVFIDLDTTPSDDPGPTFNFDFGNVPTMKAKVRGSVVEDVEAINDDDDDDHKVQEIQTEPEGEKRGTLLWTFPTMAQVQPKRATMDWTFPQDAPTEINLSLNDNDDLPGNLRPQLKHSATAPLGQFQGYMHSGHTQAIGNVEPLRDSTSFMIDLNLDISDPVEIERPSTAISATGSTSTVLTSGDPFDLEDDSDNNDPDHNRLSFHKGWRFGGRGDDASSIRSLPIHSRGDSQSSQDFGSDRAPHTASGDGTFAYEQHQSDSEQYTLRQGPTFRNKKEQSIYDGSASWLSVGHDKVQSTDAGILPSRNRTHSPAASLHTDDATGLPRHPHRRESDDVPKSPDFVEFPKLIGPEPKVLLEEATMLEVMHELERLLDNARDAFTATAQAVHIHTGIEPKDFRLVAENYRGLGPSKSSSPTGDTGDEYGS